MGRFSLLLGIGLFSTFCFAQRYTPEMYAPAEEPVATVVETQAIAPAPPAPATEVTSATDVKTTTDTYTTIDGQPVVEPYHIVVGSFQDRQNAENLCYTLIQQGCRATVAINQQGLCRVFYASEQDENVLRALLSHVRASYPDAWLLKLER